MKGLEHLNVVVQRGANVRIPIAVPSYEVKVLEAIHESTEEAPTVTVMGEPFFVEVEDFDPREALDALKRKYIGSRAEYEVILKSIYPDARTVMAAAHVVDMPKKAKKADAEQRIAA